MNNSELFMDWENVQEETHKGDNGSELSCTGHRALARHRAPGDKSQQDTKGEGQSVTLGEVCDPLQEPREFCNLHKQGNMDYVRK